ncbi:PREDICTED: protein AF-9 [Fragaria vesca subsp. vesca]|uniref:protein AF-9 n=1 Tax=Fragaria vesca subsp. vesca TaxID=101020 RepID=UPI0002C33E8D|nr:PREDICTED: protein AF-9 [Fragaria vesca subsp. vesca]
MGSCISKCSPKSQFQIEEDDQFCNQVQDKLVISTQPPKPTTPIPSHHHSNKISPFPSSPSHSTSSASSFSYCTTTTTNSNSTLSSSSSTLSSSASSVSSSSKIDRSFSNEFLWSCYKENPHISRIASIKEAQKPVAAATLRKHHHHYQPSPINRGNGSPQTTPQKRVRTSTSPTLKRQKSFRKEPEKPVISRSLRSPSPSRRFNVSEKNRGTVMANPPKIVSNIRPASPNNNPSGLMARPCLKSPARETQTRIHRISSKIDEVAVREALAHDHYMESVPEDIDNPLISLDCFIFL